MDSNTNNSITQEHHASTGNIILVTGIIILVIVLCVCIYFLISSKNDVKTLKSSNSSLQEKIKKCNNQTSTDCSTTEAENTQLKSTNSSLKEQLTKCNQTSTGCSTTEAENTQLKSTNSSLKGQNAKLTSDNQQLTDDLKDCPIRRLTKKKDRAWFLKDSDGSLKATDWKQAEAYCRLAGYPGLASKDSYMGDDDKKSTCNPGDSYWGDKVWGYYSGADCNDNATGTFTAANAHEKGSAGSVACLPKYDVTKKGNANFLTYEGKNGTTYVTVSNRAEAKKLCEASGFSGLAIIEEQKTDTCTPGRAIWADAEGYYTDGQNPGACGKQGYYTGGQKPYKPFACKI